MEVAPRTTPAVSGSFLDLRRLSSSFTGLRDGRPPASDDERDARRAATELGAVAIPLCTRHFAGVDDERAQWAHELLAHLARDVDLRTRVVREAQAIARSPGAPDRTKLRAVALLAELGAEPPEQAELADPIAARRRSSHELALCLGSPADVARAGDHLLDQLTAEQILDLLDDLIDAEPGSALAVLDELLARDVLDEDFRHELRQRRASARQLAPAARRRRRPREAVSCRAAQHPDGRRILLAADRQPGCRPPRHRALCVLIGPSGHLLDGHYADELATGALETEFVQPLQRSGFEFQAVAADSARRSLIEAARRSVKAGRALPRPFYLGRYLFGLSDQHLDGTARSPAAVDLAALLDRAISLLAAKELAQARPLLERYVDQAPSDAEGHAQLGLCHLQLGDAETALAHLNRATWLAPDEPLHHWNAAAAAHRAGRMGACYLALEAYAASRDVAPGAESRREIAERFVDEYARLAVLQHPGATPRDVATEDTPGPRRWGPRRRHRV